MRDVKVETVEADEVASALGEWLAWKRAALEEAGAFRSPLQRGAWEKLRAIIDAHRQALLAPEGAIVSVPRRRAPMPEGP